MYQISEIIPFYYCGWYKLPDLRSNNRELICEQIRSCCSLRSWGTERLGFSPAESNRTAVKRSGLIDAKHCVWPPVVVFFVNLKYIMTRDACQKQPKTNTLLIIFPTCCSWFFSFFLTCLRLDSLHTFVCLAAWILVSVWNRSSLELFFCNSSSPKVFSCSYTTEVTAYD